MDERPPYRLPRMAVPRRYQLEIVPDADNGVFHGSCAIAVDVLSPIQDMILNAVQLQLTDITLTYDNGQILSGTVSYHPEEEQVTLHWPRTIDPGRYTVSMQFDGRLSTDLRGFYRTMVNGKDGKPIVILSTQCEATDARRIFPCWDEPDFKAAFSIALVVDPEDVALSNAREIHSEMMSDGKRRVVFAETIPMSTYLVALVVGPFELTLPDMVGLVPIRIAARPGFAELTAVARAAATGTLQFFQDYFGIPYPADKIDHVAIPDFEAGAMENLGCVTYREEALLVDKERSAPMEQMQVVSTIAHETAHMWFGDLVTMRWWNGIWLNEAFATFMQELATDALHPEWDVWTTFGHGRANALEVDGLASTRPIEYPVGPPLDAWGMFDVLTYQKGGSVLRMLEQYLTPEVFRHGIRQYLELHRYGNTETSDLWDALESASGEPVRTMMDGWVFQPGYPLVLVEWDRDQQLIRLRQHQFRYQGEADNRYWQVPVVVTIWRYGDVRESYRTILGLEEKSIPVPSDMASVLVNQGAWGFYRVAYEATLWQPLLERLGEMTPLERLSLADDAWAAILANEAPLSHIVPLWRAMVNERDPDVWGAVSRQAALLDDIVEDHERPLLQNLIRTIAGPVLQKLTWEPSPDEDVRHRRLRAILIQLLGTHGGDPTVRMHARELLSAHWQGTSVPPELLTPIVNVVASFGGETEWARMYQQFRAAETPQEEKRYLYALADFIEPDLVTRTLELYQSSAVRTQDGAIALGRALANRHAHRAVWNVVEDHWDELLEKYPKMIEFIVSPVATVVDEDLAHRMVAWLHAHPVPQSARHIAQTIEFQEIHRALAKRIQGQLGTLLEIGAPPQN
ncbi:MAG: peptidase [Sulfobacillus benefaciens]|uniref:Aminopeptidase n=1 Tax=Sulfobacillus benefaciens TaxID=453960 RepID=A0A2T2XEP3_9FIRM|nr:MAG: peptidase [Sulfobacillus benefaciens]